MEQRLEIAKEQLWRDFNVTPETFAGKSFVDVGSGSGRVFLQHKNSQLRVCIYVYIYIYIYISIHKYMCIRLAQAMFYLLTAICSYEILQAYGVKHNNSSVTSFLFLSLHYQYT